jgi:hypothetical protein
MRERFVCLVALIAAGSGVGCSSLHQVPMSGPTTTTIPLTQGSITVGARQFSLVNVTLPTEGQLNITVNWRVAGDPLSVGVAAPNCTNPDHGPCYFYFLDEATTTSPSKTFGVALPAGTYVVTIDNRSAASESVNYILTLTVTLTPVVAAGP